MDARDPQAYRSDKPPNASSPDLGESPLGLELLPETFDVRTDFGLRREGSIEDEQHTAG
jgi:hypothetical protein